MHDRPAMTDDQQEKGAASSPAGRVARLRHLLRPRSIAVIGASDRDGSFGKRLLSAIRSGRYAGTVYPVNPRYEQLDGLTCYPSLDALPEVPDLAAFAVADQQAPSLLEEAAEIGIPAAALFGRGYAPPGEMSSTQRLSAIARTAGMAVCGNNCMGFVNIVDGLKISGNPPPIPDHPGTIGLISHSGSTWSGLVGNQRQLVFNYAISAGQEIATTMADYLEFLLDQPETRVIGCIMETVRDPEGFIAAAERADVRGIPIIALKLGRSEQGRQFALAHSGALSGSDAVYGAVLERHNIVRVRTVDEFVNTLELFSTPRRPSAAGIGIVTDSGGERELIVDIASDVGAPFAKVRPETEQRLAQVLDPGMSPLNPVDSYGDGRTLLEDCLRVLADDPEVGIVALATNLVAGRAYADEAARAISEAAAATAKPALLFGHVESAMSHKHAADLRAKGIPVLLGTASALSAMTHLITWHQRKDPATRGVAKPTADLPSREEISALIAADGPGALSARTAAQLMDRCHLPRAASRFVETRENAVAAAEDLGFPVVMKTANPAILHKTEHGGVLLNIASSSAAAEAYDQIRQRCGPLVEIQKQIAGGTELILGMTYDPQFGPAVTLGLGGILTELLSDAVTFLPPVTPDGARQFLERLKGYPLLTGFRGSPPADLAALCELIARFSTFCASYGALFSEIDLNPIKAGPDGAVAVDALFIPSQGSQAERAVA
ncbi:acetate--CoA ligase family protein [Rhodoligotrophos ferricapiens]|uniref:acetate--CoA ligase family protein n=1 Tax=Rhodoligotrophos ferricapiens TaxID=3069264 RepID=UPI00315DD640